jgi:putative meiotic phospholipase SPO1
LKRVNIPDFDVDEFTISSTKPITLALALSGGGYRAFLNGAGMLAALDDRSYNSSLPGHLGGLLQGSTYLAGISGGSWLVMSLIMSDFKPLVELRHDWNLFEPLLEGVPNLSQMQVSRNDVQVLPSNFKDNDLAFYDALNRIGKREYDEKEDVMDDDIFDSFYKRFEEVVANERMNTSSVYKRETLRTDTLAKKEDAWFEGFRTFFRDLFKKKEDPMKIATVLSSVDISSDVSLRSMKRIFNFYKNLHLEVRSKRLSGFAVSFTDYWGRALSRRIFPKSAWSPNFTFTSVIKSKAFQNFEEPFPIISSDLRNPGVVKSSVTSNIFEFTPFEFGSWDMNMFVNLKYLGSLLYNGKPIFHISNQTICFTKFDNAGFIIGTSSSLFNNVFVYVWQLASSSSRNNYRAIKAVLNTFGLTSLQDSRKHPDYALYSPNPFYRYNSSSPNCKEVYDSKTLYMVDGGEDGQNIPFVPFLQHDRGVDMIFSFDSTADRQGWPNGTIIANTALRFNNSLHLGTTITIGKKAQVIHKFPDIPNPETFISKGLNRKPIFFGCYLEKFGIREYEEPDFMSVNDYLPPIIGYFSNSEYNYPANTSTFKLTYEYDEVSQIIENSYNVMTYGNSSKDPDYARCMGCLLIKREFDRKERGLSVLNHQESPIFCKKCYSDYCFN